MRRVALCADDFGLTEAACKAILELAHMGALSCTSCIVDFPWCAQYGAELQAISNFSIGLHLNLVQGDGPYPRRGLVRLITRAYVFGIGDRAALSREIARQFDLFEKTFGCAPAFVDGHEHAHQLPVVREALLEEISRRYCSRVAVRSTVPQRFRGLKASVISALGGKALTRAAVAAGCAVNRDFGGVYDFGRAAPFARLMAGWLNDIADLGLIMCHPQLGPGNSAFQRAGVAEHDFFKSAEWSAMRKQVALTPFDYPHFTAPPGNE